MSDAVYNEFLAKQLQEGKQLAAASDILTIDTVETDSGLPDTYVVALECRGALLNPDRSVQIRVARFQFGVRFPMDYLRVAEHDMVVTWLGPLNVYSPHVAVPGITAPGGALPFPAICIGEIASGTTLIDLIYRCYEIITYVNFAPHDPLNEDAARWARQNLDLFPTDCRPLKRPSKRRK